MKYKNSTGMILHETKSIVAIITWNSRNRKTGDVCQITLLNKQYSPVEASLNGYDTSVCMDCKHRPLRGASCYVNLGQAPSAIYRAYRAGSYLGLDKKLLANKVKYRTVRFGAYGEPVLIPISLVKYINANASAIIGYTHAWHNDLYKEYAKYFLASVDTISEFKLAQNLGWKTFRVLKPEESTMSESEVMCPAKEYRVNCLSCKLCSTDNNGKSIAVVVHGLPRKIINFVNYKGNKNG